MSPAAHTLLWFRPLSPLAYTLPASLASQSWANTLHIPIDILQACAIDLDDQTRLSGAPTWLLSSPTAAHLAATLGKPSTIAAMGTPTQSAWRDAGGAEPAHWLISTTGESMGLQAALSQHTSVCVLRGKDGRNDLIQALQQASVSVSTVAIYQKMAHPQLHEKLNAALASGPVTLYLSSTDQPARLLAAAIDPGALRACPVIVSHSRIKTAALALGFKTVTLH
jgi:uroporphyrinogen-III synthase